MENKKDYSTPEIEIVMLDTEDVITTSREQFEGEKVE